MPAAAAAPRAPAVPAVPAAPAAPLAPPRRPRPRSPALPAAPCAPAPPVGPGRRRPPRRRRRSRRSAPSRARARSRAWPPRDSRADVPRRPRPACRRRSSRRRDRRRRASTGSRSCRCRGSAFHAPSSQSARSPTRPAPYTAGARTSTSMPEPIRAMRLPVASLNQRLPSGPGVIALGDEPAVIPALNSVTTPAVVIRPMRLPLDSVNQRRPSAPARDASRRGAGRDARAEFSHYASWRDATDLIRGRLGEPHLAVVSGRDGQRTQRLPGSENSTTIPSGVIRADSAARALCEPEIAVRARRDACWRRTGCDPGANSVTAPVGVIRPIRLPVDSVNHRFPSGPAAIMLRPAPAVMPIENSVTTPAGVMRPIRFPVDSVNHILPSGPAGDAERRGPCGDAGGELDHRRSVGRHPTDCVVVRLGEPKIPVGPRRHRAEPGTAREPGAELGHRARRDRRGRGARGEQEGQRGRQDEHGSWQMQRWHHWLSPDLRRLPSLERVTAARAAPDRSCERDRITLGAEGSGRMRS